MGDAAADNFEWRQQYGRNASWATSQFARDYNALLSAPAGSIAVESLPATGLEAVTAIGGGRAWLAS